MKKILYIISVILLLSMTSCPIYMDSDYSFNFYNDSNDTIVVVNKIIPTTEVIESTFSFTYCPKRIIFPNSYKEVGSTGYMDLSELLKPEELWIFMVYTKETQREFEDPDIIYKNKKYLLLFAIKDSYPSYGVKYPPTQETLDYAVVLDPPSGY